MASVEEFNIDEEVESIQAVYCQPGECQISKAGSTTQITLQLKCEDGNPQMNHSATLILSMSETYPKSIPQVSVISPELTRQSVASVKQVVEQQAQNLIGQLMLFDIISLVQENLNDIASKSFSQSSEGDAIGTAEEKDYVWTSLLHLDHMRSKNRYVKTIEKWTSELGLTGRLIFMGRLILILLQGGQKEIKEYISRQRTVNVDVDSHGRSCKERMMSVLCEERTQANKRFEEFSTVDCKGIDEVEDIFYKGGLSGLYQSNVKNFQGKYF